MAFGAFLMSREIFDHHIFSDQIKFRLFVYILGKAVFAEEGVKKGNVHIKRGQYLRSLRNLREDLLYFENNSEKMYSISTLQRKITELVADGSLQAENTKLGTLFTVVNYNKYQGFDYYQGASLEHQRNTDRTPAEHQKNGNETVKEQETYTNETLSVQGSNGDGTETVQGWDNNNKDINVNNAINGLNVEKENKKNKDININNVINVEKGMNEKNEGLKESPGPISIESIYTAASFVFDNINSKREADLYQLTKMFGIENVNAALKELATNDDDVKYKIDDVLNLAKQYKEKKKVV